MIASIFRLTSTMVGLPKSRKKTQAFRRKYPRMRARDHFSWQRHYGLTQTLLKMGAALVFVRGNRCKDQPTQFLKFTTNLLSFKIKVKRNLIFSNILFRLLQLHNS